MKRKGNWRAVAAALLAADPSSVSRALEKKYLNSKVPTGVCMYLPAAARETVDSAMPSLSAIALRPRGFKARGPSVKKAL